MRGDANHNPARPWRRVSWAAVFVWVLTLGTGAQDSGAGRFAAPAMAQTAEELLSDAPVSPVAIVRANFTPENRAYWTRRTTVELGTVAFDLLLALAFLFSGASARIRDFAHARFRRLYGRMLVYLVVYGGLVYLASLPLHWYGGFALEHQYGLSNESLGHWLGDQAKEQGVTLFFFGVVPLLALAYRAMQRFRRWWLALAFGAIPVVTIAILIQPVVIDPLFNKFTPLQDAVLRDRILDLAEKAGIPGRNVYQVDKSAQTKKFNAYVSGFGASQRIVLWDTTLQGMDADEILFVMGHEMGHYTLGHIWKGIAFFSAMGFALFFSAGIFMNAAVRRFGARWRFQELHDIASIPLFSFTLSLLFFVAQPGINSFARSIEHDADTFGLEVTRLNEPGARAFIKLGAQNKSNPEPPRVLKWLQYTHPPLVERVQYALDYRPWEQGRPNQKFHGADAAAR